MDGEPRRIPLMPKLLELTKSDRTKNNKPKQLWIDQSRKPLRTFIASNDPAPWRPSGLHRENAGGSSTCSLPRDQSLTSLKSVVNILITARKSLGEAGQYLKEAKDKATILGGYAMKGMKTKKQVTWNTRFWLLMIDIRTLALTIEHDLSTLRALTDAAGKPVGWAVAGDMQSKEVTAGGIRCVWVWPKEVEDPLLVPGKLLYVHGGAFCLGSPETHKQLAQQLSRRSKAA
ncbi:unnamed protein product, partial [Polarella glacialis]